MWSIRLITPEMETSTHRYFSFVHDYALGDPAAAEVPRKGPREAFVEDIEVCEGRLRL